MAQAFTDVVRDLDLDIIRQISSLETFESMDDTEMSGVEATHANIDPIWTSSRTARQIYSLGEVEKVRLLVT